MIWNIVTPAAGCYGNKNTLVAKGRTSPTAADMGILMLQYSHPLFEWCNQARRSVPPTARRLIRFHKKFSGCGFLLRDHHVERRSDSRESCAIWFCCGNRIVGDFMQRLFTECRVNANVEWCFVIGQCHGNNALFDVGVV